MRTIKKKFNEDGCVFRDGFVTNLVQKSAVSEDVKILTKSRQFDNAWARAIVFTSH